MSQDQLDRLRRLRAARGENATRLEAVQSGEQGAWASSITSQQGRPGGRGGALIGLLILVLVAVAALSGVGYMLKQFHSSVGGPRRVINFVVTQGEGVTKIADELQSDKLVSSSLFFRLYYQFNGGSGNIQAGTHVLNTDMSMDDIAKALKEAPAKAVVVSVSTENQYNILAGKRVEELATILDKGHVASYDAALKEMLHGKFDYWFIKGLPAGVSLEGFLAPGKYVFTPNMNPHSAVALMLRRFAQQFTPAMTAQAKHSGHTIYEVVTLASIVQRESSDPTVQKAIAGVLWNRMKPASASITAQKLSADPTVQYALGYSTELKTWWRNNITQDDYSNTDSPYNTYLHPGLPPGPISNPGLSAINAVLYPTPSKWLFYEARLGPDGKHNKTYFCDTLECHQNHAGVAVN